MPDPNALDGELLLKLLSHYVYAAEAAGQARDAALQALEQALAEQPKPEVKK